MPKQMGWGAWLAVVAVMALGGGCRRVPPPAALSDVRDVTLYIAARIYTLDPQRPEAQALAVSGDKVVALGSRAQLLEQWPLARVVELSQATIVPGLEDAHGHLQLLGKSLAQVQLSGSTSAEEVIARMKMAPEQSFQGDWLLGQGWDQTEWQDARGAFPEKRILDANFPGIPVFLTRIDGHAGWANSVALRKAGIGKATVDPPGGRILRDGRGEPTGVLIDNAMNLVTAKLPPLTDEQLRAQLASALQHCARMGLTSIHDAGIDLRSFRILQQWDLTGMLPLRVYALADGQGEDRRAYLDAGIFKGRMLVLRGVKLLADGALGSRGAALNEPYSDDPSTSGMFLLSPDELRRRAHDFMAAGFQVAIHAIGDKAVSLVLDVLSTEARATGTTALRHRVEHAQIVRAEDFPRFAEGNLIASMQPTHATSDMAWAPLRLGPRRLAGAYAWKRLLNAGAALAFGSDFPVEDANPLWGLYAARTRQDENGMPAGGWLPEERLSAEEALRAFTTGAAYAAHAEQERGMLKEGMQADFVAFDQDVLKAAPIVVRNAQMVRTVVAGKTVSRGNRNDRSVWPGRGPLGGWTGGLRTRDGAVGLDIAPESLALRR